MSGNPRWITSETKKDGTVVANSALSPESFKRPAGLVIPARKIIPVIFVPGIMGSNLKVKSSQEGQVKSAYKRAKKEYSPQSWRPDSSVRLLNRMRNAPPALRQVILNKDTTVIDDDLGDVDVSGLNLSLKEARARGWGEIMWGSYGPMVKALEQDLGRFMFPPEQSGGDPVPTPWWQKMLEAGHSGSSIPSNFQGTKWHLRQGAKFRFPVFACGYNWLESNAKSGRRLAERIKSVIASYADAKGPDGKPAFECKQVIIVTHSMGGLVGRMAAKLLKIEGQEDKILGIVHGEMPAAGAPVVYRRLACGTEGGSVADSAFALIVGNTAPTCLPILAFSPGALQLAPTPDYPSPWLVVERAWGKGNETVLSLPAHGDPYGEILLQKGKWFCPVNEAWLDPAELHSDKATGKIQVWEDYETVVDEVRTFHAGTGDAKKDMTDPKVLGHYYHPNTYAHYGDDPKETTFGRVRWWGGVISEDQAKFSANVFGTASCCFDDGEGKRAVDFGVPNTPYPGNKSMTFECLGKSDCAQSGDGTVPASSGAAPGHHGVKRIYQLHSFGHQDSYNHDSARGATFFAILDMVKNLVPDPAPALKAGR